MLFNINQYFPLINCRNEDGKEKGGQKKKIHEVKKENLTTYNEENQPEEKTKEDREEKQNKKHNKKEKYTKTRKNRPEKH